MRQAFRSSPIRAGVLLSLCVGLLALPVGLRAVRADEWSASSTESGGDDSVEFVLDPLYPFPPGIGSKTSFQTAPDKKEPVGAAPKPSDVFVDDTGSSRSQRDVLPSVVPNGFGEVAVRAGWWDVNSQGSPTMVGMYQGLTPSPFWNLELLKSDGVSTIDLYGTGLDNDTSQAGLYVFTPWYAANVRYERFLHRLDHDPLLNMPRPNSGAEIVAEDMNVGDDYAVRIQDFRTDVGGKLSDNLKYNVDVWIRRKSGERQALGTHHGMASGGFPCRVCHVVSQRQEIDWMTTRVEPSVEAKIGEVTVEYSRPMRFFGQNDSVVTRSYGSFHPYNDYSLDNPYAVVPETVWQSDRLKVRTELPHGNQLLQPSLLRHDRESSTRHKPPVVRVRRPPLQLLLQSLDPRQLFPLHPTIESVSTLPGAAREHHHRRSDGRRSAVQSPDIRLTTCETVHRCRCRLEAVRDRRPAGPMVAACRYRTGHHRP